MNDPIDRTIAAIRGSQMLRLLYLGFLVLLLQIPIFMIHGLVSERQSRKMEAAADIAAKWGAAQAITGPALVVPYAVHVPASTGPESIAPRMETRHAVFLPENLNVGGNIDTDMRKRGIFSIPVYSAQLTFSGDFVRPDPAMLGIDPDMMQWDRAHIVVGLSDTRAIQQKTSIFWNGRRAAFLPGTKAFADGITGVHAPVAVPPGIADIPFEFQIAFNGSSALKFTPFGKNTNVNLSSDYGDPSFQGNWLPTERSVGDTSFSATWSVPFLGRGYPQAWHAQTDISKMLQESQFGVELVNPLDHYRMAQRSVKYAALFILLTFATVWLIQILAGVRVHSIQYLMLGAALCIFYLLELALSEHLGFPIAYIVASTAVVALIAGYSATALGSNARAAGVAAGVALLYAYLYLLLTNEDYALLAGSIGLFAILAAIMYATRHLNWYALGAAGRQSPAEDSAL